jgi:hypothetical protein
MIFLTNDPKYTRIAQPFRCETCKQLRSRNSVLLSWSVHSLGWDFVIGLMYYSDTWRKHRRCFHQKFKRDVSLAYRPAQMRKVHQLLQNLLSSPQDFVEHYTKRAHLIYCCDSGPVADPRLIVWLPVSSRLPYMVMKSPQPTILLSKELIEQSR